MSAILADFWHRYG